MTPEERERMHKLSQQIAIERDNDKFNQLVKELNDLPEPKGQRLEPAPESSV